MNQRRMKAKKKHRLKRKTGIGKLNMTDKDITYKIKKGNDKTKNPTYGKHEASTSRLLA